MGKKPTTASHWAEYRAKTRAPSQGPGARNVVSGNRLYGIRAELAATGCTIQGNLVGLQGNGTAALANGLYGVAVARSTNTTVQGNLIGGNTSYGVHVSLTLTTGTVVRGNFIGTDATGTLALPNVGGGMLIDGANDVRVGGTNSGDGNVISIDYEVRRPLLYNLDVVGKFSAKEEKRRGGD